MTTAVSPGEHLLAVPPLPPRLVGRPRLLDALDADAAVAALTLVTAGPAGGKSVLLAEWARSRDVPTPWLAPTAADNDPVRFWSLFLKAVRLAGPAPLPTAWSGADVPGLLDTLFGGSDPPPSPAVVVVDDAHLLTDAQVLAGLDRIVERWSPWVHLVLAARSVPLLPLHRYRLAGQLAELRAADLAMTPEEASRLLHAHGVHLEEDEVTRLTARMEGWTGGLRLAAMRMAGSPAPDRVAHELALDQGSVGEYLVEEVLAALPVDTRHVLLTTSVLDEVSVEAAVAVSGLPGAGDILTELARTNAFVIPVDASLTTFRYHHLFREVLRLLARRRAGPGMTAEDRRVVGWFRAKGEIGTALRWALRSGEAQLARAVLVRGGLATAFVASERLAEVPLDKLLVGADPDDEEAAVATVAVAALRAQRSSTGRTVACRVHAPALHVEPGDPDLAVTVGVARLLLVSATGETSGLVEPVERMLLDDLRQAVAAVPGLRGKLLLTLGRTRFFTGRPAEVEPLMREALEAATADDAPATQLEILGVQALANASAARPKLVTAALVRADEVLRLHPGVARPTALDVARARQAFVVGDLPAMREALDRALAAGPIYDAVLGAASIAYLQGLYLAATGHPREAHRWLCAPALDAPELGLLGVYRDAEIAALEVELGHPRRALQLLRRHDKGPFAMTAAVPTAFCLLALGEVEEAERTVRPVLTTPSPQVDRFALVTAMLCSATIAGTRGDDAKAVSCVAQALDLAGEEVVAPFLRMGPAFAALLARHPELGDRWPGPAPRERGGAPAAGRTERGSTGPPRLAEPLTEREQAILRLLPTSMSAAEIAASLYVSVNTVKSHIAAVYRKLGVGRRREAVQRARELELL